MQYVVIFFLVLFFYVYSELALQITYGSKNFTPLSRLAGLILGQHFNDKQLEVLKSIEPFLPLCTAILLTFAAVLLNALFKSFENGIEGIKNALALFEQKEKNYGELLSRLENRMQKIGESVDIFAKREYQLAYANIVSPLNRGALLQIDNVIHPRQAGWCPEAKGPTQSICACDASSPYEWLTNDVMAYDAIFGKWLRADANRKLKRILVWRKQDFVSVIGMKVIEIQNWNGYELYFHRQDDLIADPGVKEVFGTTVEISELQFILWDIDEVEKKLQDRNAGQRYSNLKDIFCYASPDPLRQPSLRVSPQDKDNYLCWGFCGDHEADPKESGAGYKISFIGKNEFKKYNQIWSFLIKHKKTISLNKIFNLEEIQGNHLCDERNRHKLVNFFNTWEIGN